MKKLNITKEQFNRSNYFQRKYGKLEYVSESGRLFKTSKGKVLKFNESSFQVLDSDGETTTLSRECPFCHKEHHITIDMGEDEFYDRYDAMRAGELIQRAFPMLDANQREFIKTGICDTCWDSL